MLSPPHQSSFRTRSTCRICASRELTRYVDLGNQPLANSIRSPDDKRPELKVPLAVLFCDNCALSQLSDVVAPELMFSNYVYRSGISATFAKHCQIFAQEAKELCQLASDALVLDIGANDGTLLSAFKECGFVPVGVDPAGNIAGKNLVCDAPMIVDFWGDAAARTIRERFGKPGIITATNVVAHVDDLDQFFGGVAAILDDKGCFVLEVPYLADLIEKNEFDTIYHEHVSYFLLRPLLTVAARHHLTAFYVRRIPVHGGGIRVYFRRQEYSSRAVDTVRATLAFEKEAGLYERTPYRKFARQIDSIRKDLKDTITNLVGSGKRIAGFGASAKGATLLNSSAVNHESIMYIADDTPEKQGMIQSGTGIPIVSSDRLRNDPPDYLLILAWNFIDEILEKTSSFSTAGGRYIIPVPALRYID